MKKFNILLGVLLAFALTTSMVFAIGGAGWNIAEGEGWQFRGLVRFEEDVHAYGDFEVDGAITLDDATVEGVVTQAQDTENVGQLPTWLSVPVTYGDLTLATVASGEIWYVHDVVMNVTTNYDCTGNDCAVTVGDTDDPDGFLVLADATLQAADVDGPTGFEAGWQGFLAATKGVYFDEATSEAHHGFIFAGTDTILFDITGTSPTAGAGVVYIYYTRLQ